jgi:hypothetical protein
MEVGLCYHFLVRRLEIRAKRDLAFFSRKVVCSEVSFIYSCFMLLSQVIISLVEARSLSLIIVPSSPLSRWLRDLVLVSFLMRYVPYSRLGPIVCFFYLTNALRKTLREADL